VKGGSRGNPGDRRRPWAPEAFVPRPGVRPPLSWRQCRNNRPTARVHGPASAEPRDPESRDPVARHWAALRSGGPGPGSGRAERSTPPRRKYSPGLTHSVGQTRRVRPVGRGRPGPGGAAAVSRRAIVSQPQEVDNRPKASSSLSRGRLQSQVPFTPRQGPTAGVEERGGAAWKDQQVAARAERKQP